MIEQVYSFNYLGNLISYAEDLDIDNKLHNYLKITGILNNVFRPQNLKRKRIKLYEGWNFNSGNYLFTTHTK